MGENKLKVEYRKKCLEKILSSNLLLDEDYEYISLHQAEAEVVQNGDAHRSKWSLSTSLSLHLFIASISLLIGVFNCEYFWIQVLSYVATASFLFNLLQTQIHKRQKKECFENILHLLDAYIQHSQEFQTVVQKSLRFIKEMEIAAMGYTLISGRTWSNHSQRTRQTYVRECLQLRYQVLKSCVNESLSQRDGALEIAQMRNGDSEMEFDLCLCKIPIDELGPCFDKSKSFQDLVAVTDKLCIDILRDTCTFMHAQRSEFLKILSVTAFLDYACDFDAINHHITHLRELCKKEQGNLFRVYQKHQNGINADVLHDGKFVNMPSGTFKTPLNTAVHSIQVHLRAALQVAFESEESAENDKKYEYLKDHLLPQLKIHLDASNQCISESIKCLNPDSEDSKKLPKLQHPEVRGADNNQDPVLDASLLDPREDFSEDQIFEAVVDDADNTELKNLDDGGEDFGSTRKKRIDETKHVMKELQSVLHIKTSAEKREIAKSKLFPNYVPKMVKPQPDMTVSKTEDKNNDSLGAISPENDKLTTEDVEEHNACFSGDGVIPQTHTILRQPRRLPPPGRTKRKPPRIKPCQTPLRSEQKPATESSSAEDSGGEKPSFDRGPVPLGFGFPSLLASQAVQKALSTKRPPTGDNGLPAAAFGLVGNEATFGDSDSDS